MQFLMDYIQPLSIKIGEHFFIAFIALILGVIFAVPVGILLSNSDKGSRIVIGICSILQTVPSLALLAIMIPIFGVGKVPAVIALFVYSLLPIIRNTILGMNTVSSGILDAAKGMGMHSYQIVSKVQMPLAMPVIMSGIRLSAVYVVSWTSLAAYIGAGGLGDYIFAGLNTFSTELIILGTVPVILMALVTDYLMGKLEKITVPRTTSKRSSL